MGHTGIPSTHIEGFVCERYAYCCYLTSLLCHVIGRKRNTLSSNNVLSHQLLLALGTKQSSSVVIKWKLLYDLGRIIFIVMFIHKYCNSALGHHVLL
jgi:hypothetical protein